LHILLNLVTQPQGTKGGFFWVNALPPSRAFSAAEGKGVTGSRRGPIKSLLAEELCLLLTELPFG